MLDLVVADDLEGLANELARPLASSSADPFSPEWVAIPSIGMRRWLELRLATVLGASAAGLGDGICANVRFEFPGALRTAVLAAGADDSRERWQVGRLVFALMELLDEHRGDVQLEELFAVTAPLGPYDRARRIADLFDRYGIQRPRLLRAWASGRDIDGAGRRCSEEQRWQPHLFRLLGDRLGAPSPAERLPELLEELRNGALTLELPERLSVFGLASLPGGGEFLALLEAIATERSVGVYLLEPSLAQLRSVIEQQERDSTGSIRTERSLDALASHPLLRAWGGPYRERSALIARGLPSGVLRILASGRTGGSEVGRTLLRQLQSDLGANRPPDATFDLASDDRSVQIHECFGVERELEVLRDALLHRFSIDPSLAEEDVFVLCPALAEVEPAIAAVFGPPGDLVEEDPGPGLPPRLRYRVADRSLRDANHLADALRAAIALVTGRFSAMSFIEFLRFSPVRRRFGLDDDALETITRWLSETNVRFGLSARQRARWSLRAAIGENTLEAGLRALIFGMAVRDDVGLCVGDVPAVGVEGEGLDVLERLGAVADELCRLEQSFARPKPLDEWINELEGAIAALFSVDVAASWQLDHLRRSLRALGDFARVGEKPFAVELSVSDVRRLLEAELGSASHLGFFQGGVTFSSLVPLRAVPRRVIAIVGIDRAEAPARVDADDLIARARELGDRDSRAEVRQSLLEAVLAASDQLIVTRSGTSLETNQEIPPSALYSELAESIFTTLGPSSRARWEGSVVIKHPRQPYDEANFQPGALGDRGPWSFDPSAFAAAVVRGGATVGHRALSPGLVASTKVRGAEEELTTFELESMRRFLRRPVRSHLEQALGVVVRGSEDSFDDALPVEPDALERWKLLDRALFEGLASGDPERYLERQVHAGAFAPGRLGEARRAEIAALVAEAASIWARYRSSSPIGPLAVDAYAPSGVRIVGTLPTQLLSASGTLRVVASTRSARHDLELWVDLIVLGLMHPERDAQAVLISSGKTGFETFELSLSASSPDERLAVANEALSVVLDCFARARREPLPLFPLLGRKLCPPAGEPVAVRPEDWSNGATREGDEDETRLLFGPMSLDELLSITPRADDPGMGRSRVHRFAQYLWGAFDHTTVWRAVDQRARPRSKTSRTMQAGQA